MLGSVSDILGSFLVKRITAGLCIFSFTADVFANPLNDPSTEPIAKSENQITSSLKKVLEQVPVITPSELKLLKKFLSDPGSISLDQLAPVAAKADKCIEAFQAQVTKLEVAVKNGTWLWDTALPYEPTTERSFIPRMERFASFLLLQSALDFEKSEFAKACQKLYQAHLTSQLLSQEPLLFAQIGGFTIETQALNVWGRYAFLCPRNEFEAFIEKRATLPPVRDGLNVLDFDRQAALYLTSQSIAPVGLIIPAEELQSMIEQLAIAIPADQTDRQVILHSLEELKSQVRYIESKYRTLRTDFSLPYPEGMRKIQSDHSNHHPSSAVERSFNFNYASFFRKIYEIRTMHVMCKAGENWFLKQGTPISNSKAYTEITLDEPDLRTNKRLQAQLLEPDELHRFKRLRIITSEEPSVPQLRKLTLDFYLP